MPLDYNERHEMAIVRGGRHLFTKMSGTMGPGCRICFLLVVITIFINITTCDADLLSDNQTLLAFKASVDMNGKLENWSQGSPCDGNWYGVACQDGRVAHLVLENIGLTGPITVLSSLDQLRVLSLMGNSLNGSLPDMSNWANLKLLYLNENNFRGEIPPSVSALVHALRIDLSNNKLIGPIPDSFSSLTHLATLRLENNFLSGMLPSLNLTLLNDFNVSGNELSGRIPITLRNFDISAYAGNPELCGYPVSACNFSLPPISSVNLQPPSPSVLPCSPMTRPTDERLKKASGNRLSVGVIAAIVVGDASVLLIVIVMFLFYYWKRYSRRLDRTTSKFLESEKGEFSSDQHSVQVPEVKKSKLVFFDWKKPMFDLEDLLRASAEMLGKGSLGTAYKAVLEDGTIVAVKRLKEVNVSGRKEFEQQMELIGNTQHSHLVQLRAYYYAKEEKLLVYDYLPNGSLYSLLHGNRGPGRTPLDWTTRVKIALGAARGLAFIHQEYSTPKIPHGNVKSSNILLDKNGNACLGDFGLAPLMNATAASRLVGYRAPEHNETRRFSQKADVYSFGIVLLEILTGKASAQSAMQDKGIDLPRWVQSVVREEWTAEVFDIELMRYKNIEEELVGMLQIAMVCVSQSPDLRPKMSQVVKLIEQIRGDQSPQRDESFESPNLSPSPSEDVGTSL